MTLCIYNAKKDPLPELNENSLKVYLKENGMKNCLSCEYKYPCANKTPPTEENKEILLDKLNLERKLNDEKLIQLRIKSGYYQPAIL